MNFSIKDFFNKCDQIRRELQKKPLLKKPLMENFIFCAMYIPWIALTDISRSQKCKMNNVKLITVVTISGFL